jgi:mono/diheme cytochrome c family protein
MKWLKRILGVLLVIVVAAALVLYVGSNWIINTSHTFEPHPITAATDTASLARGEHLARLLACFSCHGDSLEGNVLIDDPLMARVVTPNVPARLETLTDAEFAGFLRTGVRKDGKSPFLMPPPGLYHLSDADLAALLGYLRTLPSVGDTLPVTSIGPIGRFAVLIGEIKTSALVMDTTMERVGQDPAHATTRQGEYIARLICADCHGFTLTGDPENRSPGLSGVLGYSPEEFVALLRTGTPRDAATKLTLMGEAIQGELHYLTDDEIDAVYNYLKALPPTGVR